MRSILYFILVFLYIASSDVSASDDAYKRAAQQKAQQAINSCWAISEKKRASVNTNKQRSGILDSALCMEDHIIELSEKYIFPESLDLVLETKKDLEKIRAGYGRFYWNLYNTHNACDQPTGCGSAFHTMHNSFYAKLLEGMILNCYEQIEEYGLDRQN